MKKEARSKQIPDSRAYYEVFGDTVVMLNTFKAVTFLLCAVIFFQAYVNLAAQKKAPLVIAVDGQGRARADETQKLAGEPDEIQISAFIREFLEAYTAYDSKSIAYDFSKALNYMHSHFQKRAQQELPVRAELKDQNLYSRVSADDVRIEKNVPGWVHVSVTGTRRILSYLDPAYTREMVFNSYITLAKVPRTKREPYGLLVYDYREPVARELIPPIQGGKQA